MGEREDHGLKERIAAAEAALLRIADDTPAERFAGLASRLLRRSPEKLWDVLKEAAGEELDGVPELGRLLEALGQRLIGSRDLGAAAAILAAARRWDVRLPGPLYRDLAQAQLRAGNRTGAEETIRELLRRDAVDVEAARMLYRLLQESGRAAEAHEVLNRLLELDPSTATATFAHRERRKLGEMRGGAIRIALLSSYVVDPLIPFLDVECRRAGLIPAFYVAPFNQYTQEVLNLSSGLYTFNPEIVFVALDVEDVFPEARGVPSLETLTKSRQDIGGAIVKLVRELHARSSALVVVHELALVGRSPHGILDNRRDDGLVRWVEDLNRDLAQEFGAEASTFLLPLRDVLGRVGAAAGERRKLYHMARMRHGDPALRELARYSMRYVKPLKGLTRKCVVVDLDGTLWGGVVGEVGAEGIQLGPTAPGSEFVDFQQALLNLTKRGILLAICSKNNPDDVMPVLREHKHMVLREEHFSAVRINWRNKAENLAELAKELNIGIDSLVFFDDNPVERELIRQMLPQVLTVEVPRDASQFRSILEDLTDFELLALTREDELRTSQYQANRQREALERSSGSLDEYLHSLEIRVEIARAASHHVPRLVQMFGKTNQFNATTKRYQALEVERLLAARDRQVYVLEAADRFTDHGLVGTAVVFEEREAWRIDSFLLSCRAMGLSVETVLLKRIADAAAERNVPCLIGEFAPTAKNGPTADLYRRHGFQLLGSASGTERWVLDPRIEKMQDATWIAVKMVEA